VLDIILDMIYEYHSSCKAVFRYHIRDMIYEYHSSCKTGNILALKAGFVELS